MKKIIAFAATLVALFSLTSCEDFLNKLPLNYWYCGSECVIAGSATITHEKIGSGEYTSVTLSPKAEGLDEGIIYGVLISKELWDKALAGETIPVNELTIASYSQTGKENSISCLGATIVAGYGTLGNYKYGNQEASMTAELSSTNYLTFKVEAKAKTVKKLNPNGDGSWVEIPEAEQKEINFGAHFAGIPEIVNKL